MTRNGLSALLLALSLCPGTALAEPFTPKSDDEVVEQLPRTLSAAQAPRRMLEQTTALPLVEALQLARQQIQLGRLNGDPRAFGRAEALLARFTESTSPSPDALVLRATVRQFFHDFSGATADLERALQLDPKNGQGWITLATIQTVRGEYDAAKQSCGRLLGRAPELVTATCLSQIAGLNGGSETAKQVLTRELGSVRESLSPAEVAWSSAILAELYGRTGDVTNAERLYRALLAQDESDAGSRIALAELLLNADKPDEAFAVVADHTEHDGVLLRAVIAAKRAKRDSDFHTLRAELRSRMDAATLRGDSSHQREEAIYLLHVEDRPAAALEKARANFASQREPVDLLVLAECAARMNDLATKAELSRWMTERKMEFPQVVALLGEGNR